MNVYLDASILLPTIMEETTSAAIEAWLRGCDGELMVSDFAVAEVASAMSRLVRTRRLDADDASARLADFDIWRAGMTTTPDITSADARLANAYVRRFALMLRAPDALHAAICRRLEYRLATLDRRLGTAARELGIDAVVPVE